MMNPIEMSEAIVMPIPEPVNPPSNNKTRKLMCYVPLAFFLIFFIVGVIFIAAFFALERDELTGKPTPVIFRGRARPPSSSSSSTITATVSSVAPIWQAISTKPIKPSDQSIASSTIPIYLIKKRVVMAGFEAEVFAEDGTLRTINIMLDSGSFGTLIRQDLANSLGLKGLAYMLVINGAAGIQTESFPSQWVEFRIRSTTGVFLLKGSTVPNITRPLPVTDWSQLRHQWNHLSDLPLTKSGGITDVLIGLDNNHLMVALESRVAGPDAPVASRTALGWVASGVVDENWHFNFQTPPPAPTTNMDDYYGSTTMVRPTTTSSTSTVQQELTQYSRVNFSSNCNFPGKSDISIPNLESITLCGDFCRADPRCKFFVYHPVQNICYLKWTSGASKAVYDKNRQCGQKVSIYDV